MKKINYHNLNIFPQMIDPGHQNQTQTRSFFLTILGPTVGNNPLVHIWPGQVTIIEINNWFCCLVTSSATSYFLNPVRHIPWKGTMINSWYRLAINSHTKCFVPSFACLHLLHVIYLWSRKECKLPWSS